jgi:hypothetical protein
MKISKKKKLSRMACNREQMIWGNRMKKKERKRKGGKTTNITTIHQFINYALM